MASIAKLVVSLGADVSDFQTDMQRAGRISAKELKSMERQAEQLNATWNRNFKIAGAAVVAALGVAIKSAIDFENAMAEVSTLLDDTSGLEKTSKAVKDMAVQFGQSPVKEVKALYQAISAGATDSTTQMELLTAANKLAVGGLTDVDVAMDALTGVINAYGSEAEDITRISDVMFTTMKLGKTTIGEISAKVNEMTPLAAKLGVEFGEVGAALATVTAITGNTSTATTQLKATFTNLLAPAEEGKKLFKQLGVAFGEAGIAAKGGLLPYLKDLYKQTDGNAEKLKKMLGSVEAVQAVFALATDDFSKFADATDAMGKAAGATQTAYEKMADSTKTAIERAAAAFDVIKIGIGENFLSSVSTAAIAIASYIDEIASAIETLMILITARAGVAIIATFVKIGKEARLLAVAMAILGGPGGALVLATVAIVLLSEKLDYFNTKGKNTKQIVDGMASAISGLTDQWIKTATAAEIINRQSIVRENWINADKELIQIEERLSFLLKTVPKEAQKYHAEIKILTQRKKELTKAETAGLKVLASSNARLKELANLSGNAAASVGDFEEIVVKATRKTSDWDKVMSHLNDSAFQDLAAAIEDLDQMQQDWNRSVQDFIDIGNPVAALVREFSTRVAEANVMLAKGDITLKQYWASINALSDGLGKAAAGMGQVSQESDKMSESMLEAARILERTFTTMWDNILSGAGNMFDGIKDSFKTLLASLLHQWITSDLIKTINNAFGPGGGGFASLDFGAIGEGLAGIAGVSLGSALGGGGQAASIGSAIGTIAGKIIGNMIVPGIGGVIGSVLGGIAGGLLGGLFEGSVNPSLQLVGSDLIGDPKLQGRTGPFIDTALGGFFQTAANDIDADVVKQFTDGIKDFDNAFAGFLSKGQLEKVTDLLKDWGTELEDSGLTLEAFIKSRLEQIQYALNQGVMAFVDRAKSLEEEIARTGVAFRTEDLFKKQPDLFSGRTQAEFLAVVEAFQDGTETIIDAFNEVLGLIATVQTAIESLKSFSGSNLSSDYADYVKQQSETLTETLSRLGSDLFDAVANFDGSPEQLTRIGTLVDSIRQGEINLLGQIDSIQKGINSSLDSLRANILETINGPKSASRIFSEARHLIAQVANAPQTPESITALTSQFEKLIGSISAEDVKANGSAILSLIDQFQKASNTQLDAARQNALDSAQSTRDLIGDFVTRIGDPLTFIEDWNRRTAEALESIVTDGVTIKTDTTAYDDADTMSADLSSSITTSLDTGTNNMATALSTGVASMSERLAAAIGAGFAGANVTINISTQEGGLVTQ